MTEVADTSIRHYQDMKNRGEIGEQCQKVFETLRKLEGEVTINELGKTIELQDLANSTISGRLNNLKDNGLVEDLDSERYKRPDKYTGIKCKVWRVKDMEESEWVTADQQVETDEEDLDSLFIENEQSDKPEPGEVIWE